MNILELKPVDTPDYMTDAWLVCIYVAVKTESIVEQFRKDTGLTAVSPRVEIAKAFVEWVNENIWGKIADE